MKQQQISGQSDAAIDCRQQQLQVIYQYTHEDYKGHASDRWPRQHHDKPTLFVLEGGITTLKLLEDLTDEQIQEKLPGCLYMRAVDLVRKELLGNLGWQACEGPDLAMKQIETTDGSKEVYAMIRKLSTTQVALALFCSKSDRNCLDSKSLLLPRFANRQRFAELVAAFVADLDEDVSELFARQAA